MILYKSLIKSLQLRKTQLEEIIKDVEFFFYDDKNSKIQREISLIGSAIRKLKRLIKISEGKI